MGGVDKIDFLISLCPMVFQTKRWLTRVILHLVSKSLVNVWIEYKEWEAAQYSRKKNIMDLLSFWEHVAEALCKAETNRKRPVGRPSFQSLLNYCAVPNKKAKPAVLPNHECWYDGFDHWPQPNDLAIPQKCKIEGCKGKSRTLCEKYNVYLCLSKDRNCFKDFHSNWTCIAMFYDGTSVTWSHLKTYFLLFSMSLHIGHFEGSILP